MRVAFIWQGINGRYGHWRDGLWAAMKIIERSHEVKYFDVTELDRVRAFSPNAVLYWESPVTLKGKDSQHYKGVMALPFPKALLFAGGPVEAQTCYGFDLFFVESAINEQEFEKLGLPWMRAFGVNTQIMRPETQPKVFDGIHQGTCASWKRQWLLTEALGGKALVCGRFQDSDPEPFRRARGHGAMVLDELQPHIVASMINASKAVVNTSEFWGGGQRATLEGMACGVPVIVMSDSPKNREYVEESGAGVVCDPTPEAIREALTKITTEMGQNGLEYVRSKWTEKHYADAILDGIYRIQTV